MTFSEAVDDPPGDVEPDDVTNPLNYLLVDRGADGDFQTDVCGAALGDDETYGVSVTYDDVVQAAELSWGNPPELPSELYRLLACGSTSIVDLQGNPLDGNGDGTGGDDMLMQFRVDSENAWRNGHFDCDLSGWDLVSGNPLDMEFDADDHEDSMGSGSLRIQNLVMTDTFVVSQCVELEPNPSIRLNARMRLDVGTGESVDAALFCELNSDPSCAVGSVLGTEEQSFQLMDTAGVWEPLQTELSPSQGVMAARCGVRLEVRPDLTFFASLDRLQLVVDAEVFLDGFESGDTSAWSVAAGSLSEPDSDPGLKRGTSAHQEGASAHQEGVSVH